MKTKFFVLVAAFAVLASVGCVVPMPTPPSLTVRTTGIPFMNRNQVVVSCPVSLSHLVVEKIDQFGKERYVVRPDSSVGVRASGMYSDQAFVLTVYGYKEVKGGGVVLVGRRSRDFRFWDSGNNSGQVLYWDVSSYELESK